MTVHNHGERVITMGNEANQNSTNENVNTEAENTTNTEADNNSVLTPESTPNDTSENKPIERTYTQDEVNRMMANEKRQGRQSVLKELGLNPEDKNAVKATKALLDSQKTAEQIAAEKLANEAADKLDALKRAETAERKLVVLTSGCNPNYIEEVFALASAKVTESVDFETALKSVKTKCPAFFEGGDTGTGNNGGYHKPNNNKPGTLGASLAQKAIQANSNKNTYFTN